MIGTVQKIEFTPKGAKKLQINGAWYFAGKVNVDPVKAGDKIDFTFSEFGEDRGKGRLKGIQDWKPVTDSSGQPQTGSTITDLNYLQSVSNIVGHACHAGLVKSPEELEKWCVAARHGLSRSMQRAKVTGPDEPEYEFDDEIPF